MKLLISVLLFIGLSIAFIDFGGTEVKTTYQTPNNYQLPTNYLHDSYYNECNSEEFNCKAFADCMVKTDDYMTCKIESSNE